MEDSTLHKKLDAIEKRLGRLEKKPKDAWDKFGVFTAVLIPAAIALAGHFIAQGISAAEIASEERQAAQSRIIAEANTRISQAELINTFMKSLTSDNDDERKIAVDAILIALPQQGPALVRGVARYDESPEVQQAAEVSLNERLLKLVNELFAADATTRQSAAQELVRGWQSDPELIPVLLEHASKHPTNENGIYNAVVVLSALSERILTAHRTAVLAFLERARNNGPNTERVVEQVESRI